MLDPPSHIKMDNSEFRLLHHTSPYIPAPQRVVCQWTKTVHTSPYIPAPQRVVCQWTKAVHTSNVTTALKGYYNNTCLLVLTYRIYY